MAAVKIPVKLNRKGYYVDRRFSTKRSIKEAVFDNATLADCITGSEEEFDMLSKQGKSVHLIVKNEDGVYVFQKSNGSIADVLKYLDKGYKRNYHAKELEEFLTEAKRQRLVVVSDVAGMGKSVTLVHLAHNLKHQCTRRWVQVVNLNEHATALKELNGELVSAQEAIDFLIRKILKLSTGFEEAVFRKQLRTGRLVLLLDGFDEISPDYEAKVLSLVDQMMNTPVEEIWITTRPHLEDELKKRFRQIPYRLEPFSVDEQADFATKYWRKKFGLKKKDDSRLRIFARACVENMAKSISDTEKSFTGVPLQIRMLTEIFEGDAKTFHQSTDTKPEVIEIDLVDLYTRFFDKKLNIFLTDKNKSQSSKDRSNLTVVDTLNSMWDEITPMAYHEALAIQVLFPRQSDHVLEKRITGALKKKPFEQITRYGLVIFDKTDSRYRFVHRTYAEYLVAHSVIKRIECLNKHMCNFVFSDILGKRDSRVIRYFLNCLMLKYPIDSDVLTNLGEDFITLFFSKDLMKDDIVLILRHSVEEGNKQIVDFLRNLLRDEKYKVISKILLEEDKECLLEYLRNPFECEEEQTERFASGLEAWIKRFKFRPNEETVWHSIAQNGEVEIMEVLQKWCDEVDVNYAKFLHRGWAGFGTVTEFAILKGHIGVLEKLAEWCGHKELLFPSDIDDFSLINLAATMCHPTVLIYLFGLAKGIAIPTDTLLTSADCQKNTLLHFAALGMHPAAFDFLLQQAHDERLDLKQMLCLKNDEGFSPWQTNAINENLTDYSWKRLLEWTRIARLDPKDLLAEKMSDGAIFWLADIHIDWFECFKRLYGSAKELEVDTERVLTNKDTLGQGFWHVIANHNSCFLFDKIVVELETDREDLATAFKDGTDYTVWDLLFEKCLDAMLTKFLDLAIRVEFDVLNQLRDALRRSGLSTRNADMLKSIFEWLTKNEIHPRNLFGNEGLARVDVPITMRDACVNYILDMV